MIVADLQEQIERVRRTFGELEEDATAIDQENRQALEVVCEAAELVRRLDRLPWKEANRLVVRHSPFHHYVYAGDPGEYFEAETTSEALRKALDALDERRKIRLGGSSG